MTQNVEEWCRVATSKHEKNMMKEVMLLGQRRHARRKGRRMQLYSMKPKEPWSPMFPKVFMSGTKGSRKRVVVNDNSSKHDSEPEEANGTGKM
jgi:hypothetical protein